MSVLMKVGLAACAALIAVTASFGVGAMVGQQDLPQIGDPVIIEKGEDQARPGFELSPKPKAKRPPVTRVYPEPRPIDDDDDGPRPPRGGDDDDDDDDDDRGDDDDD